MLGGMSGFGAEFTAELLLLLSLATGIPRRTNYGCVLGLRWGGVGHVCFRHWSLTGLGGFATWLYGVVSLGI